MGGGIFYKPLIATTTTGTLVPPAVHLGLHRSNRAYSLDWNVRDNKITPVAVSGTDNRSSFRQIFEAHRRNLLAQSTIRGKNQVFLATQYALIQTLNVTASSRYQRTATSTYCNIYACDMVNALGGYLPRVWWMRAAIRQIQAGARPVTREQLRAAGNQAANLIAPVYDKTVTELSANAMTAWMWTWGSYFGWRKAASAQDAQLAANNGRIVIALAANSRPDHAGHVSVVVTESTQNSAPGRDKTLGTVTVPLQSQAGATNFKFGGKGAWWMPPTHKDGGLWIYEGLVNSPLGSSGSLGVIGKTR